MFTSGTSRNVPYARRIGPVVLSLLLVSLPSEVQAGAVGQPLLPDWDEYEFAGGEGEVRTSGSCTIFFGTYARGNHTITVFYDSLDGNVYPYAVFDRATGELAVDLDNIGDPDRFDIIDIDQVTTTTEPIRAAVSQNLCNLEQQRLF